MDYEIYHDESLVDGYWHGIMLVPVFRKRRMLELLLSARDAFGYRRPLSFKKVRRRGKIFDTCNAWIQIAVGSLISQMKGLPYPIYLGNKSDGHKEYHLLRDPIGCKFILFCERDNLKKMSNYLDYGGKVEVTFRMGLKGGLHLLGSQDEFMNVTKLHFDGHQHYRRRLDKQIIVDRMRGLRDYCQISDDPDIIDDRSSDHERLDAQDYNDCQLLQLTDLLLGSFRCALQNDENQFHRCLAFPARQLITRYSKGYARMMQSKWFNSFCMSQCSLNEGSWDFRPLLIDECADNIQLSFEW